MKHFSSVLEYEKSFHFAQRERERKVKPRDIERLLKEGRERDQIDGTTVYSCGEEYLVVNHSDRVFITVYICKQIPKPTLGSMLKKVA